MNFAKNVFKSSICLNNDCFADFQQHPEKTDWNPDPNSGIHLHQTRHPLHAVQRVRNF